MNFEKMQNVWRSQDERFKMTIDSLLLLHKIESNQRHFSTMFFWRDFFICFFAFILAAICLWGGIELYSSPLLYISLSFLFLAVAFAWVGAFIIGDRLFRKRKYKLEPVSLRETVEVSLQEISHQIWLLKNILWWCLLPCAIGLAVVYIVMFRMMLPIHESPGARYSQYSLYISLFMVIDSLWFIYKLCRAVVRKKLLPKKRELEELLASLSEES
jgi:hypothetical protein